METSAEKFKLNVILSAAVEPEEGAIWFFYPTARAKFIREHVLLFTRLFPAVCFAQQYSIDWFKVAGSGGASAGSMRAPIRPMEFTVGDLRF